MQRLFFIFMFSFFVSVAQAGDTWFVDTRSATTGLEHLTVKKLGENSRSVRQWRSATLEEFLETHCPQKPLVIVIHGNWTTAADAQSHGMTFDRLLEKRGEHRLLIWSWSSERVACGIRKDALIKAQRAEDQANDLVLFLRNLKPNSKVSLIGFSFGAKLVCETLQMLATAEGKRNELSIRSVLLAGALDCGSLAPNGKYGQALSETEKMLIHVNPDDETLCFYPLLVRIGGPQAIGKKGVAGLSKENRPKIKSVNVARQLGTEHRFMASFQTLLAYKQDFRQYALFE
ncbi:MAG: alpha/beta hydrolase [Planctomycetaceae bacterium]|nr:alpha/beta hydrolase [Planctomycetaceae bacterium]